MPCDYLRSGISNISASAILTLVRLRLACEVVISIVSIVASSPIGARLCSVIDCAIAIGLSTVVISIIGRILHLLRSILASIHTT